MKKIMILPNLGSYTGVCKFLNCDLGYEIFPLEKSAGGKTLNSKTELLRDLFKHTKIIFKQRKSLRDCETIITVGIFDSLVVLLFNKIGLIHTERLFWWAFFIHSPKIQKLFSGLLRLLWKDNVKFIVFSECEVLMYKKVMHLPQNGMVYLPYGNWNNDDTEFIANTNKDIYFFSGGYSNRDYLSLLNAWEELDYKLIIAASKNNKELVKFLENSKLKNVTILFDINSERFDDLLRNAQACIMPFKYNTGASGQSVSLRCMRLGKLIISTDTDVMREYIEDGKTGFILKDLQKELPEMVTQIINGKIDSEKLVKNSYELYKEKFSYEAITKELKNILMS